MPMSNSLLEQEILTAMEANGFKKTTDNANLAKAIAKAVVNHIITNAIVAGGTCTPGGPIAGGKIS